MVGLTANGLSSIIATPIGEQYSHQVVSSSIDSIYDPINIKRLDYFDVIELICTDEGQFAISSAAVDNQ